MVSADTMKNSWNLLKKFYPKKHHILIACFPKSGSTYLSTIISNLSDFERAGLLTGYDRREQELSVERLIYFNYKNYVAQHHTQYSSVTKDLMNMFDIKPIILVRNLFDVVQSLYDHLHNESLIWPMAYVPDDFLKWDEHKAKNFIVDFMIPWYFSFYTSWNLFEKKLMITYNEVTTDPKTCIMKILDWYNIKIKSDDLIHAIEKTSDQSTRKNIGKSGRGENLPKDIKEKITNMSKYYPNIDFSPIGL